MLPDFMAWHRKKRPNTQFVNVFKYLGNLFSYMVRMGVVETKNLPLLTIQNPKNFSTIAKKEES